MYLNGHLLGVFIVTSIKGRGRNEWKVIENANFSIRNYIWIFPALHNLLPDPNINAHLRRETETPT